MPLLGRLRLGHDAGADRGPNHLRKLPSSERALLFTSLLWSAFSCGGLAIGIIANNGLHSTCPPDQTTALGFAARTDLCGVPDGNNRTCLGCDGVRFSSMRMDACGVCGGGGIEASWCDVVGSGPR